LDGNHPHKKIIKEKKEKKNLLDVAFDSSSKVVCVFLQRLKAYLYGLEKL
jgi:hypothetical protein